MNRVVRSGIDMETQAALVAGVVTLVVHSLLYALLPSDFYAVSLRLKPVEVLVAPVNVPENRLPPSLRLAETNARANRITPEKTPFIAARNQSAAQPVPEKEPTRSPVPRSDGESETQIKVSQGMPRSIGESERSTSAGAAGTSSAALGAMPKKSESPSANAQSENANRPRATLASGTSGLLLKNNYGVNKAGVLAVDARFSNYGDYSQRMMEAIQSSWWSLIERARFETVARGTVVIKFKLCRDGSVIDAEIARADVPQILAFACKDAVMAPAPFDVWREDMVALFGEDQEVTLTFHYL
jgi:outer membrane biosynthesis protein TonB